MKYLLTTMTMLLLMGCNPIEPTIKGLSEKVSNQTAVKKEALIVGVSDYAGTKYDLDGVRKDVPKMKALFESWGFHVTVLQDAESMSLERSLSNYSTLDKDSHFIFYYSGHGYHVKDINGDEKLDNPNDDQDETLVLSDGEENKLFIDDALFGYLNAIKAKKMVMLDSCHSGTAFKAFGEKTKSKSMGANIKIDVMKTKSFRPQESKISSGDYIVFSASQDKEESLDTPSGGLFTNAFYKQFSNTNAKDVKLMNLKQTIEKEIVSYCKEIDKPVYHPNLSASKTDLKYTTINKFFATKTITRPVTQKTILISGKKDFKEGELLSFKINTNENRGYLTIFSMENGEPFIMAQSTQPKYGTFNFQQDFDINRPIECYKSCGSCPQEVSSVYVILSEKPLDKRTIKSKGLNIDGQSGVVMKAFREQTNEAYEPVIARVEFTIH